MPPAGRPEIPFLVRLAVSNRWGRQLTRYEAVFRAMALAVFGAAAFVAAPFFFLGDGKFESLLFIGAVTLALAFGQWRAICWLDQHQAWQTLRR